MYGIILMAAMTGGVEAPARKCSCDCGCRRGCKGCKKCHGCHCGCHCGCHGCHGCYGCHCYGCHCGGCHCGCWSCHCAGCACACAAPVHVAPAHPAPIVVPAPEAGKIIEKKVEGPAPARITVSLPADAKLTIDDAATASTSGERVFESPTLPLGKTFSYTLKAQFVRDGKNVEISKAVKVQAGAEINVSLYQAAAVASR